jgi:hypothetical protein
MGAYSFPFLSPSCPLPFIFKQAQSQSISNFTSLFHIFVFYPFLGNSKFALVTAVGGKGGAGAGAGGGGVGGMQPACNLCRLCALHCTALYSAALRGSERFVPRVRT